MTTGRRVAVLGLGEAGGALATDLVDAGWRVRGFDPVSRAEPVGVPRAASNLDAVRSAELVLSVNAASVALQVARDVAPALAQGQVYADLNTGAPALKAELAAVILPTGATFADVALLGPVPERGIRTPALASGPGARELADLVRPLGMPIEVVGEEAGVAAGRKLIRSVFMKGLAAAALESLEAGAAAGVEAWARQEIVRSLDTPGAVVLERLVTGTGTHAARRQDEMTAAVDYLLELGVEPRIARASQALLETLAREHARQVAAELTA